ncbi:hypothetical protein YC2023_122884 [Brassica napus]
MISPGQLRPGWSPPSSFMDGKLGSYATWWANQRRSGSSWAPGFAVHSWIVEGSSYNFNTNSCDGSEMCGHYTQIVWRDTKKLECASVVCENGAGVFITCNYDPPGNYVGRETLLRESL